MSSHQQMEINVRAGKLTDSSAITELSNQLGYKTTIEETQKRISAILVCDDHCLFVATYNNHVVGWVHGFHALRLESDSFIEIGGLVVNELHRKQGVGKLLVAKVVEWAQLRKCLKIRVRCSTIRKEAHKFYNSIGFTELKEQKIFERSASA